MLIFPKAGSALMLLTFDWKNQGRENRCCVNVRILGELICSHSTIHSLLNCMRIRRKWENHSSDRLELDLTFGKTLKESSLNDERMQELNLISSILDVCCSKFLFNYRLQHGTLFQVHKLCHIFCFFTCCVLSIGNWQCIKIDTFSKYGQHYGPGSTCTSGWEQQGQGVRHRQAAVSESNCQLRPASRRGNTHLASQNA